MELVVAGIPVSVRKKNIKNLHLCVKPPDGHVVVSAPLTMDDRTVEAYARANLGWIRRQVQTYRDQLRCGRRQYVSGETMYLWGRQYFLKFVPGEGRNSLSLRGNQAVLSMSEQSTVRQRERFVREEYRLLLKRELRRRLPKWERATGIRCEDWRTKYMTTRWVTCGGGRDRLWFNVQLAQKPVECLEFAILCGLLRLRREEGGAAFAAEMDRYMPNWRDVRSELNERRLDYYEAREESPPLPPDFRD